MLSDERRNQPTATEIAALYRDAARAARDFGQRLTTSRHPNPMREREAPSPALGLTHRIRILRPETPKHQIGFDVDNVRAHNEFVSSLGIAGRVTP